MPTIEITLTPGEAPKIEAKGFQGRTCRQATQPYEKALGGEVAARAETRAAAASADVKNEARGGG